MVSAPVDELFENLMTELFENLMTLKGSIENCDKIILIKEFLMGFDDFEMIELNGYILSVWVDCGICRSIVSHF